MVGAFIINDSPVAWGFWVTLLILMVVILLNVIAPEVRRSAFRRTIQDIVGYEGRLSRVGRGEIKMHLTGNGPYWWGEEVKAGLQLSWKMIIQPGFLVLSIHSAWVYSQFTLVLMVSLLASESMSHTLTYCSFWVLWHPRSTDIAQSKWA